MSRKAKIARAKQIVAERSVGIEHPRISRRSLPCIEEGTVLEWCTTCNGPAAELRHVRDCNLYDKATRGINTAGIASCINCSDYRVEVPSWENGTLKFDEFNLYPNLPGKRFNSSFIAWENGYVFVWRNGWAGSDLYVCRMDARFQPLGRAVKLNINHPDAAYGREDPRLFVFRGRLHVSFTGVVGKTGMIYRTNVLYARLQDDLKLDAVYSPRYRDRAGSEKNWVFFEYDNKLHCVYSTFPHRVLVLNGERVETVYETTTRFPWFGGEPRGGTSPLLIDGEYWHIAHDRIDGPQRIYRALVYTFDSKPPFGIKRYIPRPIMVADSTTKPRDQYCPVIWPAGAVLKEDEVLVCSGEHDRWTRIDMFRFDELNQRLVTVEP